MPQFTFNVVWDTEAQGYHVEGNESLPVDSDESVFDDPEWRAPTEAEEAVIIDLEHRLITLLQEQDDSDRWAKLYWSVDDVRTIRPKMTDEAAMAFLVNNENHIIDRLTELGWDVLDTLLDMDGYTTTKYGEAK